MRRILRLLAGLVLIALVWLGVVAGGWLPRPDDEQRQAVATLDAALSGVGGERNVFPALWLSGYAVPEAELEAVAAADAEAFEQAARAGAVPQFKSTAEGRYAALPQPPTNDPLLCRMWGDDCLARVRAAPAASRARLAEFAPRLARGDLLARYDHHRYGFRPRMDSPLAGPAGLFQLQQTAAALDYVEGRAEAAFARLCRDTAFWRRLRQRNDSLIIDMLGVAQISGAARLYAEMLAAQPDGFTPPCQDTFAPLADAELDQCRVMAHEFRFVRNTVLDGVPYAAVEAGATMPLLMQALVNRDHVIHESAAAFAQQCGAANQERIRRRDPAPLPVPPACDALDWTFDPVGCAVYLVEVPAYNDYYLRVLDLDARLKLLQSALWLRGQPAGGDRAAQFAARPAALQSTSHALSYEAEGPRLRMVNLQQGRGRTWEIPLPAATVRAAVPLPAETPAGGG